MADKKISQFPTFDGTADSEVFFVVGSGEADNPNASNYRYPFDNLTTDITKAGSAWTTGTDLIYTLTGAVGLGTSAPIYQLDVANTGRFRSDLIVSGDMYVSGTTHINKIIDASITGTISGVTGEFADGIFADSLTISGTPVSTGGSIEVPGGGGSVIGGDVSNINFGGTEGSDTRAVNFQVGGVDKLVIGSDGNVSISEDLRVSGNIFHDTIDGTRGFWFGSGLQALGYLGASAFAVNGLSTGDFGLSSALGSSFTGALAFGIGATEKMRIDSAGNVGIGTTSPTSLLTLSGDNEDLRIVTDVGGTSVTVIGLLQDASNNGSISVNNSVGNNKVRLQSTGVSVTAVSGAFTESLTVSGNSVLTGAAGSAGGKWSDGVSAGDIYYNGGNVGIGTDDPNSKLEIHAPNTSTAFSIYNKVDDDLKMGSAVYDNGGTLSLFNDGVVKVHIDGRHGTPNDTFFNAGNVGIGTTTPITSLDVHGTLSLNTSGATKGLWFGSGDQARGYLGASDFAVNGLSTGDFGLSSALGSSFTGALAFGIGSTEKMRIDSAGNVGMGTLTPGSKLDVDGDIKSSGTFQSVVAAGYGAHFSRDDKAPAIKFQGINSSDSLNWTIGISAVDGNNNKLSIKRVNDADAFTAEPFTILSDGNVGIGIDSPAAKLHVTGGKILAPSGDFTESLTISGVPVSTGNGDGEPAFSSDARLKDDVYTLSDSSDKIKQIRGVGFMWNENSSDGLRGREDVGVIAQEVQQILPSAVEEGSDGYLKVKYHRLIPLLLESVKDLQAENKILKERMDSAGL